MAKERKAAKPLADPLARTKEIWERLRRKSHVPREERQQLVAELYGIITGKCKNFVLKHDSVRVIQTAIKYATPDQKKMIARELAGSYCQLAESKYAKFLIGKLLVQGDDEIRDFIVPEFFGHVRRLIKHPEASWILDDVYRGVATKQQKAILLREWYGAEFALFRGDNIGGVSSGLADVLLSNPSKRTPIMRTLHDFINNLIQKKMTGFTLLHDAMLQYFLNTKTGTEEVTEFIELIRGDEEGDLLKNLAFTKSGSRLVCLTLAQGTAKDRKQILRVYKDVIPMMSSDPNGHIIILAAYEVIDDTVLTAKSIFPELFSKEAEKQAESIIFYVNNLYARTVVLYLLQGRSKALFPASLSSDLEVLAEMDVASTATSKKDPKTRRYELTKSISSYLLKAIEYAAADLGATSFGCQFMTEVLFGAEGDKVPALNAIATAAATDPCLAEAADNSPDDEVVMHVASTPHGGKMLKSLINGGPFDHNTKSIVPVVPTLEFANILYPSIKPFIAEYAVYSPFVVRAVLESSSFSHRQDVLDILRKHKERLQRAAEESVEQRNRREAMVAAKDGLAAKKGQKLRTSGAQEGVGNKGCALLLEML